ncbi:MAG: amidohydrolase/deacetylase family metallohydrolase [Chloroflexi bacterium]|nr:MAG: amidohydrolase/deacetylase family metallohydrolase [Chloroflexota bacterium]
MNFDLIVRGGHVLDPGQGLDGDLEIGVRNGRIAALQHELVSEGPPPRIVDASGALVVPGLIDIHAHVYTGVSPLTVPADEVCSPAGVTTIVSAGDAGAHTIEGFRQLIVNQSRTRVLCFLHISSIGLASFPVGESLVEGLLDVGAAEAAIARFPEFIVGIKVRQGGAGVTGSNGLEPLRRAAQVKDLTGLPVMVHITDSDAPIEDLLGFLNQGDIVTHCFTGSDHGLRERNGISNAALAARKRGVLFDVGHGAGSFDFGVAEAAARMGFWPDTISTDLHSISAPTAKSLPSVMSKMLAVGMPLKEVIEATTSRAAKAINRESSIGSLVVGRVADIAVLEKRNGEVQLTDTFGNTRTADRQLMARATIRAGVVWGAPAHPGIGVAVLNQ